MFMGRSLFVMFVNYDYKLLHISLEYEFTITVDVYDLCINRAVIRKHVRFNRVRKASRRLRTDAGTFKVSCQTR